MFVSGGYLKVSEDNISVIKARPTKMQRMLSMVEKQINEQVYKVYLMVNNGTKKGEEKVSFQIVQFGVTFTATLVAMVAVCVPFLKLYDMINPPKRVQKKVQP